MYLTDEIMENTKQIKPLPFGIYFGFIALLSLVGIVDSAYLSISHFRVYTDIDYRSFCAISKAINCDTVSQSSYSVLWGVPVPIWGVLGYGAVIVLLINAWRHRNAHQKPLWPSLFFVSLAYAINSIVLAVVSSAIIHSHCIMCILSHAVNFGLLFGTWIINRRFGNANLFSGLRQDFRLYRLNWRAWGAGATAFWVIAGSMIVFFPDYWKMDLETSGVELKTGTTDEGYPWIGAENPNFVITEFSDYQCFQCRKMHHFLRQLVSRHPTRIRLVHRHFPMDNEYNPLVIEPFHTGSGKMAIIALFAQAMDKFWEVNDLLFDLGKKKMDFNTVTIAENMGVSSGQVVAALKDTYLRLRLKHDIAVGMDLGVTGTPGFVIDGEVYIGTIPKAVLEKIISDNE